MCLRVYLQTLFALKNMDGFLMWINRNLGKKSNISRKHTKLGKIMCIICWSRLGNICTYRVFQKKGGKRGEKQSLKSDLHEN